MQEISMIYFRYFRNTCMPSALRTAAPALLLFLIAIAVYSPAFWHDFVIYDDPAYVTENPHILSGLTLEGIRWAFTSGFESNWLPLTRISHMLDVQIFGLNPSGHHIVNALLHAASTTLLYFFLNRTTNSFWLSMATALFFGLHPLRVESVAWVSERKDVLCTLFGILTFNAYARYAQQPQIRSYLAVLFFFALGLMSKPMLVSLPLLLLTLDWWPLHRWKSYGADNKNQNRVTLRLITEKIPFLALAASSSLITYLVQQDAGTVTQTYTFFVRLERACVSYLVYLQKTIWPVKLAVIYPFSKYPPTILTIIASALILFVITILVFRFRWQAPYILTGWLWYLIAMLPVIGIIQVGQHSVADRYTYLPHIGVFILAVWGANALASKWRHGKALLSVSFFIITIAMITLTSMQLKHWKNSTTLFKHALNVTENNWIAHTNLGMVFLDNGKIDEAIFHFQEAIVAKPSYVPAYQNMGYAFRSKGDLEAARNAYQTAASLEPGNPKSHLGLGLIYTELESKEEALNEYHILQRLNPEYGEVLRTAISKGFSIIP